MDRHYNKADLYAKFYDLIFGNFKVSAFTREADNADISETNKFMNDVKDYITISLDDIDIDDNISVDENREIAQKISDNLGKNIGYITQKINDLNNLYLTVLGWEHVDIFREGLLINFKEYLPKSKIIFLLKTTFILNAHLKHIRTNFTILDSEIDSQINTEDIWMQRKGLK